LYSVVSGPVGFFVCSITELPTCGFRQGLGLGTGFCTLESDERMIERERERERERARVRASERERERRRERERERERKQGIPLCLCREKILQRTHSKYLFLAEEGLNP
jgi:hypothetical protein